MGFACSIVAGMMCIQAPIAGVTTLSIDDGGIWVNQSAVFTSKMGPNKTWRVSTGRSMEWAPPRIDAAQLAKACVGGACISYWRNCEPQQDATRCSFTVDEGGGVARTFTLEASDHVAFNDAIANAGVLVGGTAIPFLAFKQEAPSTQVPYLKPQGPQPQGF